MAWVTATDALRSRTLRKYPDKFRGGSIKAIAASDAIRPSVDLFLQSRGGPLHNTCSSSGALHNETKKQCDEHLMPWGNLIRNRCNQFRMHKVWVCFSLFVSPGHFIAIQYEYCNERKGVLALSANIRSGARPHDTTAHSGAHSCVCTSRAPPPGFRRRAAALYADAPLPFGTPKTRSLIKNGGTNSEKARCAMGAWPADHLAAGCWLAPAPCSMQHALSIPARRFK